MNSLVLCCAFIMKVFRPVPGFERLSEHKQLPLGTPPTWESRVYRAVELLLPRWLLVVLLILTVLCLVLPVLVIQATH